ncbi:hypothetical protein [Clostridium sp. AN503]|uniref:hypothetical protein n=1 Tax=Clostridium sp. AN503 TaxID=3160598 RepID=UPI003458E8F7
MVLLSKIKYVLTTVFICILLSVIGYALPTNTIFKQHVAKSAYILDGEGTYPKVLSLYNSQLDNFTDALMINIAAYDGGESLLTKLSSNYRYKTSQESSISWLLTAYSKHDEPISVAPYSRYWHGYIPFVKLALFFTTYQGIRQINAILQILVFAVILTLLIKRNKALFVLPYTILWISLNPSAIQLSMQFSSIYYVFSIAIILLLYNFEKIRTTPGYGVFFMLIGIVTSWLDFLTYPILTLGIPLTILMLLDDSTSGEKLKICISTALMWSFGYFGMWAFKWIISSLVLKQNVIGQAMQTAAFRTSSSYDGETWTKLQVLFKNIAHFKHFSFYLLFLITPTYSFIKIIKEHRTPYFTDGILFCGIAFMPIAWYIVLSNHSYIHDFFTFRSLGVSIFALSCFFINLTEHTEVKKWKK